MEGKREEGRGKGKGRREKEKGGREDEREKGRESRQTDFCWVSQRICRRKGRVQT